MLINSKLSNCDRQHTYSIRKPRFTASDYLLLLSDYTKILHRNVLSVHPTFIEPSAEKSNNRSTLVRSQPAPILCGALGSNVPN